MGCVRQAVLEFDEEVQAPWRPRLVPGTGVDGVSPTATALRPPSRRSPSRVGACRTPARGNARPTSGMQGRGERSRADGHDAALRTRRSAPPRGGRRVVGPPRAAVRLTRRARRLAVVLAMCGGVVLGSWLAPLVSGGSGGGLHLAGVSSVVVEPGDTLWSIAADVADGEDIRAVVDRIQELNGLEGSVLVPGQVLQLP